jgi:hypothetical protein
MQLGLLRSPARGKPAHYSSPARGKPTHYSSPARGKPTRYKSPLTRPVRSVVHISAAQQAADHLH